MRRIVLVVLMGLSAQAWADDGSVGDPPVIEGPVPGTPAAAPPTYAPVPTYAPAPPPGQMLAEPAPARRHHVASITVSPVHFILPMLEVTGEFKLAPKVSVAGILGAGRIKSGTDTFAAFELGGQAAYYPFGNFDGGLQLGAEVLYLKVQTDNLSSSTASGQAFGTVAGPFGGYKYVSSIGFTFIGQVGVEFLTVKASSGSSTASDKKVFPLLNLQVGWSF